MTTFANPQPEANPTAMPPRGRLADLMGDLSQWPELGTRTLRYHLKQSDALAAGGFLHAAVHEATSFLEALVQGITLAVTREPPVNFERSVHVQSRLKICRDCLVRLGYIDADQCQLLVGVFQIARAKGTHPGVTDEPWCRLARQFVRLTAEYMITRYATWRSVTFKPNPTADGRTAPAESNRVAGAA